jgi:large subunit ribosomal protein L6e
MPGVPELGRSASKKARGTYRHCKKGFVKPKEEKKETKEVKEPRWYAADDASKPLSSRKGAHRPTRLRKSIQPGTILIILAGRFQGKRVVFLKQLETGLLLVTGPYKLNGVPLRRVNQAYVIATSTRLDITSVNVTAINDSLFAKEKKEKKREGGESFIEEVKEKKTVVSEERKKAQAAVDGALNPIIAKTENLEKYLNAKFTLTKGVYPHALKF